ncbi:RING-H2 finger protein ATL16 [Platanthera guangdongensis]|uniref:RING-type E3 ubiquitin transferase n=1 Tax=Platanthera guangdongensis TaxID=2320717 RepID=A0ABR2LM82_9ASPA
MPPERTNPDIIIPSSPPPPPPPDSLESSFPILTISIIGILATAIILLSYYAYVTKCSRNWRQFNTITRLHRSLRRHREGLLGLQPGTAGLHGLDELAIQGIPTFRYRRGQPSDELSSNECPVCLNEFKEEERVRQLPNCLHVFHIDCIDAWLSMHANCPLCRSEITRTSLIPANSVTELVAAREEDDDVRPSSENVNGGRERKLPHGFSMGDECIDIRNRGGEFGVQLMRRSFSMDSSNDRQLYIAVQEILRKNSDLQMAGGGEEGSSSTGTLGRVRRSFFSFGHYGSSKNSVLPIDSEV